MGPRTAELLQSKGLNTVGNLVGYYPSRYEKYVSLSAVSASSENAECAVLLTVIGRGSTIRAGGRTISHFKAADATGDCRLTFFNMPYMVKNLPPGSQRVFMGIMKLTPRGLRYMEQPRVYSLDDYHDLEGTLQPVYPLFQIIVPFLVYIRIVQEWIMKNLKTILMRATENALVCANGIWRFARSIILQVCRNSVRPETG